MKAAITVLLFFLTGIIPSLSTKSYAQDSFIIVNDSLLSVLNKKIQILNSHFITDFYIAQKIDENYPQRDQNLSTLYGAVSVYTSELNGLSLKIKQYDSLLKKGISKGAEYSESAPPLILSQKAGLKICLELWSRFNTGAYNFYANIPGNIEEPAAVKELRTEGYSRFDEIGGLFDALFAYYQHNSILFHPDYTKLIKESAGLTDTISIRDSTIQRQQTEIEALKIWIQKNGRDSLSREKVIRSLTDEINDLNFRVGSLRASLKRVNLKTDSLNKVLQSLFSNFYSIGDTAELRKLIISSGDSSTLNVSLDTSIRKQIIQSLNKEPETHERDAVIIKRPAFLFLVISAILILGLLLGSLFYYRRKYYEALPIDSSEPVEEIVYGKIYDTEEDEGYINALVVVNPGEDKEIVQTRQFEKKLLEGIIPLKKGELFEMSIVNRKGGKCFKFSATDPKNEKHFEEEHKNAAEVVKKYGDLIQKNGK